MVKSESESARRIFIPRPRYLQATMVSTKRDDHNDSFDISLSNQTILILCTAGFATLGIVVYFLILRTLPSSSLDDHDRETHNYDEFLDQSDVATLNRAERRARAKLRMKKARRANIPAAADRDIHPNENNAPVGEAVDGLSRKERQKAAKALEREERKITAEIARNRRGNVQNKTKQTKLSHVTDNSERDSAANSLRIDEIFPRRLVGSSDALDEYLFYESITELYKDSPQQFLDDSIHLKIMTIRTFIINLQTYGSVSLTALAGDFGMSSEDVCRELNRLNDIHGLIGFIDKDHFVYVSLDMIKLAMELGAKMGKIPSPYVDAFK